MVSARRQQYFYSNTQMMHYDRHLNASWMIEDHGKVLEKFSEKEECEAKATTEIMFFDLLESSND